MPPVQATREPFDAPSIHALDGSGSIRANLLLTPEFYLQNPFRQLGLPVLSGSREVLRRVDQLKLSTELGDVPGQWAFAPREALAADEIRAAAQRLKNPRERLFHELFWFWPENYPHDGNDAALDYLVRDNTVQAGKLWSAAASRGHEVAWHNLAVYHHLLALEWEKDERRDEASLAGVWNQVINYWLYVIAHEKLWERVHARVKSLDDAQLAPDSAGQVRLRLPEAIAEINAALACEHAERGRMDRVALHTSLASRILGDDPARLRKVLEATARPLAGRLEQRIEKARVVGSLRPATGLEAAVSLVRECSADLRVLETLCGPTAEFFREQQHALAGAVLDEVVRYQRDSADDRGCLPLLWFLRDLPANPELATRINSAFTVIQANALGAAADGHEVTVIDIADTAESRARAFRLATETLIPAMPRLGLLSPARETYAGRVAEWLKRLAVAACDDDEIDWSMQVMMTALNLPCDAGTMAMLITTRDGLQHDFEVRRTKTLQLELAGRKLVINVRGIALDRERRAAVRITGLRHGWAAAEGVTRARYVIAWRAGDSAFEINETNFFTAPESAAENYARVLDALYFFVVPSLIERLAAGLRGGTPLLLGNVPFDGAGATLESEGSRFWKRTSVVPYARLRHAVEGAFLKITSADNPKLVERVEMLQTWNAVVIGHVIDRLAHD